MLLMTFHFWQAMAEKDYLYWYKELWLHRLYRDGVEHSVRCVGRRLPCRYSDDEGEKEQGNTRLFFWKLMFELEEGELGVPTCDVGYRLYGLVDGRKPEYSPVVEVRKDNSTGGTLRLYASRDFCVGDAVVFLSEYEENTGYFILGGIFARNEGIENSSNVCMTQNRMLRCTKSIRKGDEIIRSTKGSSSFFEEIDRVVISADMMMLGRLGVEGRLDGGQRLVHLADGTSEVVTNGRRHLSVLSDYFLT